MAFVGNKNGPRKSEIVSALGPQHLGISDEQLLRDIGDHEDDERRGVADAVFVNRQGRHFVKFNAPGGRTQRFYPERHGCVLAGEIKQIPAEDEGSWVRWP